jgi:hypothetical protein
LNTYGHLGSVNYDALSSLGIGPQTGGENSTWTWQKPEEGGGGSWTLTQDALSKLSGYYMGPSTIRPEQSGYTTLYDIYNPQGTSLGTQGLYESPPNFLDKITEAGVPLVLAMAGLGSLGYGPAAGAAQTGTAAGAASSITPEMLAAANATADPIAALNAAAGWTGVDSAYLASIAGGAAGAAGGTTAGNSALANLATDIGPIAPITPAELGITDAAISNLPAFNTAAGGAAAGSALANLSTDIGPIAPVTPAELGVSQAAVSSLPEIATGGGIVGAIANTVPAVGNLLKNPTISKLVGQLLGGSGSGGGLLTDLAGLYSATKQQSDIKDLESMFTGMYGQDSPYAQALRQQLDRRDAAAGRRSQYGPREVELQAKLAEQMTRNASTITNLRMLAGGARNNTLNTVLSGIENQGGISNIISTLSDLFKNTDWGSMTPEDVTNWQTILDKNPNLYSIPDVNIPIPEIPGFGG